MAATASTKQQQRICTYNSREYQSLVESLTSTDNPAGLITFIGPYMPDKTKAIQTIARQIDKEIKIRSLKDIVHKDNEVTRKNIDESFQNVDPEQHLLFFINGANLCGNYMGNTFSKVKYATPEERHFLNLVEHFEGMTVVSIRSDDAADETIKRKSLAIVEFPLPDSPLKRFSWKLRNYTFHGFKMPDERTEIT